MKIQLKILPHQTKAVKAVNAVFRDVNFEESNINQNPTFNSRNDIIKRNIKNIQDGIFDDSILISKLDRKSSDSDVLGIDVRMETGTGKTYCYTRLMYELNKNYGFNKFIILVPSTPIKEGTRNFILSDYTREHFSDIYPDSQLRLEVLNPQKNNKKGKKMFPTAISSFTRGTRLENSKINCLLMTDGMLLSKATMDREYDQTIFGGVTIPYDALKETKPIVIIDEPHRFKKENKAYKCLLERIKPQAIIRFGATFPKDEKSNIIDYENLVYNLNSVSAFNDGLVKGVMIQTPDNVTEDTTKVKLVGISSKKPKTATLKNEKTGKSYTLSLEESLSDVSSDFRGITLSEIGKIEDNNIKSGILLSNGQTLAVGNSIYASVYGESYQDVMLKQAIRNHFIQEKQNFYRESKIKTLTLFFIDSVYSYRGEGNDGSLRLKFEQFLREELKKQIKIFKGKSGAIDKQYLEYLKASLGDIKKTNGGYFAVDNSTKDEDIKSEVDLILRDKEKILSFKNNDGTWNTMRFVFSKWTLREGWDNPNVFQIAKLRSSGSEISKLQEVGRGLRLPVDEFGNRISEEEFFLTYLIDFTEKGFAKTLTDEINSDIQVSYKIEDSELEKVAKERNITVDDLFDELRSKKYIDRKSNIIDENREALYLEYPEFNKGVRTGKIIDNTNQKKNYVNIRKENFNELKSLWEKVNKKYYLHLEELSEDELKQAIINILNTNVYGKQIISVTEQKLTSENGSMVLRESKAGYHNVNDILPYNVFLKQINKATGFPLKLVNDCLVEYNKKNKIPKDFFNKRTISNFIVKYQEWMENAFLNRFSYKKMDVSIVETALTDMDGNPKKNILQGNIGIFKDNNLQVPDKFLFDSFIYDSPLEKENIENSNLDEVVVFGKIPRRSIKVPLYFGGTTSPDFMYVLKKNDGTVEMNLILETKDVRKESGLRNEERLRIESARKFFDSMKEEGINVRFEKQMKKDGIVELINNIIE
ncbi:type III restriction-modification system endonuclease [Clostridium perfringens]|nr:type III restriction-modification system endonuclease [Clostridium perfringens]